jgi:hypothetical protein
MHNKGMPQVWTSKDQMILYLNMRPGKESWQV